MIQYHIERREHEVADMFDWILSIAGIITMLKMAFNIFLIEISGRIIYRLREYMI